MAACDPNTPEHTVDQNGLLSALVDAVAGAQDLDDIYGHALDGLEAALGSTRSAVLLLDEHDVARFVAWRGLSDSYRQRAEGHFPWPVDTPDPPALPVPDVTKDPSLAALQENFRSEGIGALAFIPLVYNQRLVGKFMLYYPTPHAFSDQELTLARTIGRLIAFAVERTRVEQELRDVARRKDEFLATLAHELRNPLGALSAALEMMGLQAETAQSPEHEISTRQVQHLTRLIDDLLDLSRITRGLVELRKEPVELSSVVARAVEAVRPLLDRASHELFVSVPARRIVVDPVRLEQILANLLTNAAKYTPPNGRIEIEAKFVAEHVVIKVRDNGMGMPAELIPHVFDLFTQGDRTLDRAQGGLGIGLTITKQLVMRHGGTISATSEGIGRGSEFIVTLPIGSVQTAVPPPALSSSPSPLDGAHRGRRVLLVDDNMDMASSLAELIRAWGYTVESHVTARAALASMDQVVPDVILLDIGLPEIDGLELARRIRAQPRFAGTTLIAISGYGQRADIERSLAAGFAVHLVKPVDSVRLRSLLELPPPASTLRHEPAPRYPAHR